ncbi:MAG: hypothetical protein FGM21_14945, partial [Limnohabitans sp.]|nr:hypothetical protein [Limnohabitans sp.]
MAVSFFKLDIKASTAKLMIFSPAQLVAMQPKILRTLGVLAALHISALAAQTQLSEGVQGKDLVNQDVSLRAKTVGDQLIRYLDDWTPVNSHVEQQKKARRIADSVADAVRKHPEFLAARAALNSSREGVDEARAAWWP